MKNILIGTILNALMQEYNAGACDNLDQETLDKLLSSLAKLKDEMEDKLDKVLTIEETSIYLNCTRQTLNNYVKQGKLKPVKHLGGVMEFKLKDVKQFIKESKNERIGN